MEQMFVIIKSLQDLRGHPYNKETNDKYVMRLNDQISFMKEENKTNNAKIQILSEKPESFYKIIVTTRFYIS